MGSGKSLLTEILANITRPGIKFHGIFKRSQACKLIEFRSQDPRLAALATDHVRSLLPKPSSQGFEEFSADLKRIWGLEFSRIKNLRFRDLSFSEKMRVLSARSLSINADLLIIDGFGEQMEPRSRRLLKEQLALKQNAGTALIITARRPLGSGLQPTKTSILKISDESSEEVLPLMASPSLRKEPLAKQNVLLEVDRLRIQQGTRKLWPRRPAARPVNGASLYLRHGETVAILGPSGAGKSQLLEAIAGLHRPLSGRIILDGRDVTFARGRRLQRLREAVQIVFQEASAVLEQDRTVRDILEEALKLSGQKQPNMVRELERIGLPAELADSWADQLSPGEAQLVDLCRRLILKPQILLIDEPRVAGIDVDGGLLLGVLQSFLNSHGSILLATSDPNVAQSADRVGILMGGRIVELGSSKRVLESPSHPASRAFLKGAMLPLLDPREHQAGCSYADFCERQEFPRCKEKEPALAPHPTRREAVGRQRVACFHPVD